MVTIKNEYLTAKINELGAELKSLVCNDTEYIWEGRSEVWAGSCPLLFPICGGLKNDKYVLNGKYIYDFGENLAGVPHLKAKGFGKNVSFIISLIILSTIHARLPYSPFLFDFLY